MCVTSSNDFTRLKKCVQCLDNSCWCCFSFLYRCSTERNWMYWRINNYKTGQPSNWRYHGLRLHKQNGYRTPWRLCDHSRKTKNRLLFESDPVCVPQGVGGTDRDGALPSLGVFDYIGWNWLVWNMTKNSWTGIEWSSIILIYILPLSKYLNLVLHK